MGKKGKCRINFEFSSECAAKMRAIKFADFS